MTPALFQLTALCREREREATSRPSPFSPEVPRKGEGILERERVEEGRGEGGGKDLEVFVRR